MVGREEVSDGVCMYLSQRLPVLLLATQYWHYHVCPPFPPQAITRTRRFLFCEQRMDNQQHIFFDYLLGHLGARW